MESLGTILSLFGTEHSLTKRGTPASERASINDWFHSQLSSGYKKKTGKELSKRVVAIRTSHFTTSQLYVIKSEMLDKQNRGGNASAYFWYITSTGQDTRS